MFVVLLMMMLLLLSLLRLNLVMMSMLMLMMILTPGVYQNVNLYVGLVLTKISLCNKTKPIIHRPPWGLLGCEEDVSVPLLT